MTEVSAAEKIQIIDENIRAVNRELYQCEITVKVSKICNETERVEEVKKVMDGLVKKVSALEEIKAEILKPRPKVK